MSLETFRFLYREIKISFNCSGTPPISRWAGAEGYLSR